MKKRFSILYLVSLLAMLLLIPSGTVFAASNAVAQVTGVKVYSIDKKAKISWEPVEGADGYRIRLTDYKTRKKISQVDIKGANTSSMVVRDLKNGKEYAVQVAAYKKAGKKQVGKFSARVMFSPKPYDLETPETKKIKEQDGKVTIKWSRVDGASSYDVYYRQAGKPKKPAFQNLKKSVATITDLKNGKKYVFTVRANGTRDGKTVHSGWLKITASPFNKESQMRLLSQINHTSAYSGGISPSVVYSDEVAEAFANYGNNGGAFKSNTPYFLWLNTHGVHLYIFQKASSGRWKILYKFPCAIGRTSQQTPTGLWTLDTKQYKDDHGSFYVLYCTFFTGYNTNSIHSQCYPVQQDPLRAGYFGSAGCVRCDLKYAKFVYENCEGSPFLVR